MTAPHRLRTSPARSHHWAWMALLLTVVPALGFGTASPIPAQAQGRAMPPPPQSRPTVFDPDPTSCVADSIRQAFKRQLQPFQDQGEAVLASLRAVQAEMTLASLRRCVQRGLMVKAEAIKLARELGLTDSTTGQALVPDQTSPASTRP